MKNISLVGILVMSLISCGTEQEKIDLSTESGVIDYLSQSDFKQDCYLRNYYKIIRFNKDKTAQLFEIDKRTYEITEKKNGTVKIGSNRFTDDGESFLYAYIQWTYNPYFANENVNTFLKILNLYRLMYLLDNFVNACARRSELYCNQ